MARKAIIIQSELGPEGVTLDQPMGTPDDLEPACASTDDLDSTVAIDHALGANRDSLTTADSVSLYLRQIGKAPLLAATEEVVLAKQIEAGKVATSSLKQMLPGDGPQIAELQGLAAAGQLARQQLVEANLRLVISMARRYQGQGLSLSDLIQEGNLGLIAATEKYDYQKGFRFSTYAVWWIRQYLSRAVANQSRLVRLPVYVTDGLRRIGHVRQELAQSLNREPSADEVAEAAGLSPDKLREMVTASQPLLSLDTPVTEDGELGLGDFLIDEREKTPLDVVVAAVPRAILADALATLRERERQVLALRYGLYDGHERTLQEVGTIIGVTRERVRQIEQDALRKLRQSAAVRSLKDLEPLPFPDQGETSYAS